ncbi:Restriction endonuclease [Thiocapsa sp. KS1]|nr:HNH endonuclease [Thiocapsa sp. KS1]CRI65844.1 Restriction endonuclease [Thiocapsa sp. KS1]
MKIFVGLTDRDWFHFLRAKEAVEMNFWRPRSTSAFNAIQPGELFLFKTRYPEHRIVGGAFLIRHTTLPLDLAWSTFEEANGAASLAEFRAKINSIRRDHEKNPTIGCTILTQPFYLRDADYFPAPSDWSPNLVTGKSYDAATGEGLRLFEQARSAIMEVQASEIKSDDEAPRYGEDRIIKPRLGQGGFRVLVLDEYERRCSITGERTLPVLEAAHIRPYSDNGPHEISNGLLLRSDLHTLFDRGYMTVTSNLRVEVSRRIREEFSNGRDYYALHGKELKVFPSTPSNRPNPEFLKWHNDNCFLGS